MDVSDLFARLGPARRHVGVPRYGHHRYVQIAVFAALCAVAVPALITGNANLGLVTLWLLYSIMGIGFYFVFAVSGQFAFCMTFMASAGAFTSAWSSESNSFPVSLLVGLAATAAISTLFALLVRRSNHLYFAITTLGLTEIGVIVISRWRSLGGIDGTRIGIPKPEILGFAFDTPMRTFQLALGALVLVLLLATLLERSPAHRELLAFRDLPAVAETLGVPVLRYQVGAFVLASTLAGFMGVLYAHIQGFASIDSLGLDLAIGVFVMVLLGGVGSYWGPVIGALFYVFLPDKLQSLSAYENAVFGAVLILAMIAFPDGIVGIGHRVAGFGRRHLRAGRRSKGSVLRTVVDEAASAGAVVASDDRLTDPSEEVPHSAGG